MAKKELELMQSITHYEGFKYYESIKIYEERHKLQSQFRSFRSRNNEIDFYKWLEENKLSKDKA